MKNWHPDLSRSASPLYMAIADLIALDLQGGQLSPGDKLPPHRELARRLAIDVTTVAHGTDGKSRAIIRRMSCCGVSAESISIRDDGPNDATGRIPVIGITGSYGKTTVAQLVARLLTLLLAPGAPPALLLVDGLAGAQAALDRMPRQLGADLLERAQTRTDDRRRVQPYR